MQQHLVTPEAYNSPSGYNSSNLGVQEGPGEDPTVFLSGPGAGPWPVKPVTGTHIVPLKKVRARIGVIPW